MSDDTKAPEVAAPEFSRPVRLIPGAITARDMITFANVPIARASGDGLAIVQLIPAVGELLDRCIEGGLEGYSGLEFFRLFDEVQVQLMASAKN